MPMPTHDEAVALFSKIGASALARERTEPMILALIGALLLAPPNGDAIREVLRRSLCAAYDLGQLDYPHIERKETN